MNWGRKYILKIENWETNELKVKFKIEKAMVGYPDKAEIKVYNCNVNTRNIISESGKKIELYVGRNKNDLSVIFLGRIKNIVHTHENGSEWISTIYAVDGIELQSKQINISIEKGMDIEGQFNKIISTFDGISKGYTKGLKKCISGNRSLLRKMTIAGSIKEFLDELVKKCGLVYFIENETINVIPDGSYIDEKVMLINQANGMIGSPELNEQGVTVKVFLRQVKVGSKISIESTTKKINMGNLYYSTPQRLNYEGNYVVRKVIHSGDTHGNDWYTTIYGGYIL